MPGLRVIDRRAVRIVALLAVALVLPATQVHASASGGGVAENGFTTPVLLPDSHQGSEPSIAVDSRGRIFVTAPQSDSEQPSAARDIAGQPVWRSTDGGATFSQPVRLAGDPPRGGDTDLAIGARDDVYVADDWLGNTAMGVSTDGGQSFVAAPAANPTPVADRAWLAYSPHDNVLYQYWDGLSALFVGRSLPLTTPQAGLAFPFEEPVVTGCAPNQATCPGTPVDHQCTCPAGGIATDPTTGEVYITYGGAGSSGGNVGVAYSTDQGVTWTKTAIPGTGGGNDGSHVSNSFQPVEVDSEGNVYVAWAEDLDPVVAADGGTVDTGGVAVRLSRSTDHGHTWSTPITVSTTTGTSVFPTLALGAPGVVYVGYYGTAQTGTPGLMPDGTRWDMMVSISTDALSDTPVYTPEVAVADVHDGCISLGDGCSNVPNGNGLGDFFQATTGPDGTLYVAYVKGGSARVDTVSVSGPAGTGVHSTQIVFDGDLYVTSHPRVGPPPSTTVSMSGLLGAGSGALLTTDRAVRASRIRSF